MAKAKKDMIDAETFRMVKNMSMPELNSYLYRIYCSGYMNGAAVAVDKIRESLVSKLEADLINGTK